MMPADWVALTAKVQIRPQEMGTRKDPLAFFKALIIIGFS